MDERDAPAAYTGWTRSDWVGLLARLTDGFVRAIPAGGSPAAARLPGPARDPDVARIEGFARMAVAWAAWLHDAGNGVLRRGERAIDVERLLAAGLSDATNPAHPASWGPIGDRDQRIVEAAELGTALLLGGERLRQALDDADPRAHGRVLDWIALVDGRDVWPDNWVLFPMIAALARRAAGRSVPDRAIDDALDWMWAHRDGDGWYRDGHGAALDLYTGWAIHWHLLWWAAHDGDRRPRRRAEVVRRARTWLSTMAAAVAADGAYPRFGRSLGYRFAFAAPFAQAALLGIDPLPAGTARRLASGVVARAIGDGAIDPATDWFRVGVAGARPEVVEPYVSSGASAWAAHAFVALAMPPGHPFWAAPEAPLPADLGRPGRLAAGRAAWLVGWDAAGATTLHNGRSGHPPDLADHDYAATYGKRAYRSAFPADVPIRGAFGAGADDAIIAVDPDAPTPDDDAVATTFHRGETIAGGAGPRWTWSRFRLGPSGSAIAHVSMITLVLDESEVVVAEVRPRRPIRIRAGGPVLGGAGASFGRATRDIDVDGPAAILAEGGRAVGVRGLAGFSSASVTAPGSGLANLVHDRSAHPFVETAPLADPVLLAWASATRGGGDAVRRALADLAVAIRGSSVHVRWSDGAAVVASGAGRPDEVSLDGVGFHGPGLRAAFVAHGGREIAAAGALRVEGVVELDRPGVLGLVREGDAVLATVEAGARLEPAWTGVSLATVRTRLGIGDWGPSARLPRPNEIPDGLVRRVARAQATRLVTVRLEPGS